MYFGLVSIAYKIFTIKVASRPEIQWCLLFYSEVREYFSCSVRGCICHIWNLLMIACGNVNAVNRVSPVKYFNSHITNHTQNQESDANVQFNVCTNEIAVGECYNESN